MSLKAQIMSDVKTAMKNKESDKLVTLRLLHSMIKNKEIEVRPKELSEEDVMAVVKKSVKQRKDSIEQYVKANREDLVEKEQAELAIIETYLPEPMSEDEVKKIVQSVVVEQGAQSMKQMGSVMKEVLVRTAGTADGKLVSQLVKAQLS